MKTNALMIFFTVLLLPSLVLASSTISIEESHPVVRAIDSDRADLVAAWLKKGISPNSLIRNRFKEHLFDRAATHGSVQVSTLLLKVFYYYKMKNSLVDSRGTPILVGLASLALPDSPRRKNYERIVQNTLTIFPDSIQDRDRAYIGDGRTALHESAATGNVSLMKILVSKGAQVNAKNSTGETPLHFAARFGHTDAVRFLVSAGANLNTQALHTLSTPLMLAAELGHDAAARALASLGARQDLKDAFGKTARDRYFEKQAKKIATRPKRR